MPDPGKRKIIRTKYCLFGSNWEDQMVIMLGNNRIIRIRPGDASASLRRAIAM